MFHNLPIFPHGGGSHQESLLRPAWAGEQSPPVFVPGTPPLHPSRSGEPACFGQRSGPRSRFHGAAAGAVQPAPHQPRQPPSIQATEQPLHALHGRRRYADRPVVVWSAAYRLPLRSSPATIVALASMAWILSTSVSNGFSARTMKSASKPAFMAPISSSNPSCAAPLTV